MQDLLALSAKMVAAAEAEAWDELSETGTVYLSLFTRLAPAMADPAWRPLLQTLADNERRIRSCVDPWMSATGTLLGAWQSASSRDSTPRP